MPTFAMNVFLLLVDLCREVDVIMNGYWWNGNGGKGIRWRSWDYLCRPKKLGGGLGFRKIRDFNKAMLAKQGWKLLTEPDSLARRIFQARYYPGQSYLTTSLGNKPSFIWRSLVEVQDIIRKGVRWRVGDGEFINIWRDPWLPDKINPLILSDCFQGLEEALVAGLLNSRRDVWDEDILKDLFNDRDIDLIRRIPLSNRVVPDRMIWAGEENRCFTVRSCYRRIVGEITLVEWTGWTSMWHLNLPPKIKFFYRQVCCGCLPTMNNLKSRGVDCEIRCGLCGEEDESPFHLFFKCTVARTAWGAASWTKAGQSAHNFLDWLECVSRVLKPEEMEIIVSGCWGLWNERNQRVWCRVQTDGSQVMQKTRIYLQIICRSGSISGEVICKWQRPVEGQRKINVDASIGGESCGFGWVVRDCSGSFVAGGSIIRRGQLSPYEAELMGLREVLSWLKEQQWDFIDVESDSLLAIIEIRNGSGSSYSSVLAEDIRDLMANFVSTPSVPLLLVRKGVVLFLRKVELCGW
ncbi:unnamed protein product [Cuscuta europaea]|uniref:RNase H type-1 domain-containing protein n=1 Tax=Cuscuta europaea TaxID=41803 RepID=A0A9P1EM88_CUSEU|nr:unnamed protein product [Cuscuta europaea]